MKFRAKIQFTLDQSRESKKFGDKNISYSEVEFDFQDLLGDSNSSINFKPDFTARNLIIPWLRDGNIPEMIKDE